MILIDSILNFIFNLYSKIFYFDNNNFFFSLKLMKSTISNTNVMSVQKLSKKKRAILNMKRIFIKDSTAEHAIFLSIPLRIMKKFAKNQINLSDILDYLKNIRTLKLVIVQKILENS